MTWFALVSLIISVIRTAESLWPWILKILDAIDGMKSSKARFEARGKLGAELRKHKEGVVCSMTCSQNLSALHAELAA